MTLNTKMTKINEFKNKSIEMKFQNSIPGFKNSTIYEKSSGHYRYTISFVLNQNDKDNFISLSFHNFKNIDKLGKSINTEINTHMRTLNRYTKNNSNMSNQEVISLYISKLLSNKDFTYEFKLSNVLKRVNTLLGENTLDNKIRNTIHSINILEDYKKTL